MHALGEFFGHILRAVRHDPEKQGQVVRRDATEETRETPAASYTLRRTTIEEVEVRPKPPPAG